MQGIKETKEAVIGALVLASFIIERSKDGLKVDDALALYEKFNSDAEFKALMVQAFDNVKAVGDEVKDLSVPEVFELVTSSLPYILKMIDGLKK
jgi:hypothetical protein